MRILFTRFPLESAYGGAEIQTLSLMEGLMERGHAVAFAGSCPVLLEECRKRNIPAVEWQIGPPPVTKWGTISFAWRKQGMKRKLLQLLENFGGNENGELRIENSRNSKLDVLIMLSLTEKLLLTETAASQGTKVLWIEHDRIGRWLTANPWLPQLVRLSDKAMTVPVSHLSANMYEQMGWKSEHVKAIPNGVELNRLSVGELRVSATERTTHKRITNNGSLRLLCIARLSPEKGIDILIEALASLPEHITLEIVGEGPENALLHRITKTLGLEKRVTFSRPQTDVSVFYKHADVLVLPSKDHDPFGLVAAEAMLCGLPVIVTDKCGIAGYLEDGRDAVICKADSVRALVEAIKRNENGEMRNEIAVQGKKTAEKLFTIEQMVDEYEKVMNN